MRGAAVVAPILRASGEEYKLLFDGSESAPLPDAAERGVPLECRRRVREHRDHIGNEPERFADSLENGTRRFGAPCGR